MKISKQLNFSIIQWVWVSIRAFFLANVLFFNYCFHSFLPFLSSFFPFLIWKRYISCLINLIMSRIVFLILGFFSFDCQNFRFFNRDPTKISLKSGFIGIGTHRNIIDFFYYSYMFNPLFVRIILIVEQSIKDVNYAPLDYTEALKCALQNRGFDPIIVRNQKQLKKIKYRKMNMKTLVSESFQQLKGSIFILMPGLKQNEHIQIEQKITDDIYENQTRFLRSGVGFKIQFDSRPIFQKKFKNQIYFLLSLMSQFKVNYLTITALAFRKDFKYQYRKETYRNFIQTNFYLNNDNTKLKAISYIEYINILNEEEAKQQKKQQQLFDKSKKN